MSTRLSEFDAVLRTFHDDNSNQAMISGWSASKVTRWLGSVGALRIDTLQAPWDPQRNDTSGCSAKPEPREEHYVNSPESPAIRCIDRAYFARGDGRRAAELRTNESARHC